MLMFCDWISEVSWLSVIGLIAVGYLVGVWRVHRAIRKGTMVVFDAFGGKVL